MGERSLLAQCQAVADMKFTYVVSCQQYGIDKRSGDPRAKDILKLMRTYVSKINYTCAIAVVRNSWSYDLSILVAGTHLFGLLTLMRLKKLVKIKPKRWSRRSIIQLL